MGSSVEYTRSSGSSQRDATKRGKVKVSINTSYEEVHALTSTGVSHAGTSEKESNGGTACSGVKGDQTLRSHLSPSTIQMELDGEADTIALNREVVGVTEQGEFYGHSQLTVLSQSSTPSGSNLQREKSPSLSLAANTGNKDISQATLGKGDGEAISSSTGVVDELKRTTVTKFTLKQLEGKDVDVEKTNKSESIDRSHVILLSQVFMSLARVQLKEAHQMCTIPTGIPSSLPPALAPVLAPAQPRNVMLPSTGLRKPLPPNPLIPKPRQPSPSASAKRPAVNPFRTKEHTRERVTAGSFSSPSHPARSLVPPAPVHGSSQPAGLMEFTDDNECGMDADLELTLMGESASYVYHVLS